MDPAYSITSEPQPEPEKSTSDRVRELFGQSVGYLATAADEGLLGAPSFVARKIGVEDALKRVKELNPYKTSAEISGDIASMALPTGIPSKLAAGGAKLFGKVLPKAAPFLTSKAAQILANSESLAKLRGLKGMAARGAVNAAWQSAPREAMKEQPEWGSVPLAATVGAVTGPVVGKAVEKLQEPVKKIAKQLYASRIVPEGWYVHGRAGRNDLDTGRVIQLTKNWDVADQYAGKNGSRWLIKPNPDDIIDMTDEKVSNEIAEKFFEDFKNGNLSPSNDEIASLVLRNAGDDIERAKSILVEEMNPLNIVESAGAWDTPEFPNWISETTGKTFAKTRNGAIAIDPSFVEKVPIE